MLNVTEAHHTPKLNSSPFCQYSSPFSSSSLYVLPQQISLPENTGVILKPQILPSSSTPYPSKIMPFAFLTPVSFSVPSTQLNSKILTHSHLFFL